ncbi:unnamed protein product (macronuclear) [Paramecium tetraurelia]|uniref:Tyrosine-protein phosphatase domain-containing protein n=1 Tax=Paramecium tetraurelia TaxID=5888 RepID=A0E3T9_PARTE|nr:uncharacterized protein GSPATT00023129001 [Paramecium tetraurelia]CAK89956.1 unnamed protein product [Paramecium tetraurelia]|eukprot:XP_001457353.1 hypothetical protein (macronuclear) [Paramecium tetraurelia strain d4-2]
MAQNIIVGAIKIKDGLFIGDEYASQDREFIVNNKVTHIINCSGTEVQNKWNMMNIKYLTFNWLEQDNEVKHSHKKVLFDDKNENVNKIYAFIEECFQQGESCLVHSLRGQSRACCVLAAYFMKKYSWTLYKTLEYLNSRRPDLEIRASFFYQLNALESKMNKSGPKRTASWNELTQDEQNPQQLQEELIIRNTFLNSQNGPVDDIYTNLQSKLQVLAKACNQKLRWKDQLNKDNFQLATLVYSGSPDFVPTTEIKLKEDSDHQSILRGVQKTSLNQLAKQQNLQKPSNQNKLHVKQLQQEDCESFKQNAQMSNNQSFQNLLMHCAQRQKQNLQQEKKTSPISQEQQINSPQFLNQQNGVRSTSLQQNEEKKNQIDVTNNRPSSVKQKDTSPSILTNFQEFKNQVQQSLHYFNKQSEAILNMDKHLMNTQQQSQQPIQNLNQQNDSKLQIPQGNQSVLASQQKSKLDQLISPTLISTMSSAKHFEIQKTLTQSISQLQSSYQKFQQLQMKNQMMKQSQSTSQIQQQNNNKNQPDLSSTNITNISKIYDRSTHVKKGEELDSKNRQNSAEIKDQLKNNSTQKKDSLSPFQKDPIKKMHQYGPPLPQSNSQIYLRNVQCRRQAASTLRNQQKPNNSFQDKYLNQSANQVQNNSSFNNNNSNSNIEADSKMQQKAMHGLVSDVNHLKKLISPQCLTKSQAQFLKNQPIKVLQELTDKTQSIKHIKGKDSIQTAGITLMQKVQTGNAKTLSPAIKNDEKFKNSHVGNPQHLRQKIRNSSPGLSKEQESSSSFSYQNTNTTLPGKNSWKML